MPHEKNKLRLVHVHIPPDLVQGARAYALSCGTSFQALITAALKETIPRTYVDRARRDGTKSAV